MNLTIKSLKTLSSGAFDCTLFLDGKRIAYVSDDARGGQYRIDFCLPRGSGAMPRADRVALEAKLTAFAVATNEDPDSFVKDGKPYLQRCALDMLLEGLVCAELDRRASRRRR
jgi:hypothetical protein